MTSGKSSIGDLLANALNLKFFDLDSEIEKVEGLSIPEIFNEKGELFFRKKESEVLNQILDLDSFVLATGGGTPCYGKNMEAILTKSTHSFYLKLSISDLVERISKESSSRPLVKNIPKEKLPEFVGKHLFERSFFYEQAERILDCSKKEMKDVVLQIKELL